MLLLWKNGHSLMIQCAVEIGKRILLGNSMDAALFALKEARVVYMFLFALYSTFTPFSQRNIPIFQ
jgi:hypothetical protein